MIVGKEQAGKTLLAFLRSELPDYPSVKAIKRAIDNKRCVVDGRVEWFSTYRVREGERISIDLDGDQPHFALSCLYEDEFCIAFNKPPGRVSESLPYLLVHRLDKETSGVLLLAKTRQAQKALTDLFRKRQVAKEYLAICDGKITLDRWRVDNYLGKKASYQGGALYGRVPTKEKGKRAITTFETLKRGKTATLVLARPQTGRTHQIRVHLRQGGHPILGDWQYSRSFRCPLRPKRQMLHAWRLVLDHPLSGRSVRIEAPLLEDFSHVQKSLFDP